ncbi:MAG: aspartyl protease family protein [Novosphingobium sp.]|nr:aspartyl protease family protein [Novosphingobium sp.]
MPLIKGRITDRKAVVEVGLQAGQPLLGSVDSGSSFAEIPIHSMRGLIDTGAQVTMLTPRAVRQLDLQPRGKRLLGNVSNVARHNTYFFVMGVWYSMDEGQTLNSTRSYFAFEPVYGCDLRVESDFDVLIGMDIILQGDLHISRSGEFVWAVGREYQ